MTPGERAAAETAATETALSSGRVRSFILLRFTLLIAVSYLLLVQVGFGQVPRPILVLLALGLLSNVALLKVPLQLLESSYFTAGVVVADTVWMTLALVATGRFEPEFFYVYFFVLFLAAIGENLRLIALGAVVVGGAYLYVLSVYEGPAAFSDPGALMRLPFLFAVAIFYGYLVDRVRKERQRASEEAEIAADLRRARQTLEERGHELESELAARRKAEEALKRANEELAHLSQLKSDFVTTVSHELRTPLTAIKNSVELVSKKGSGMADDARERFLGIALRNVERLRRIIEDLLDISKIESGRLDLTFSEVDLADLLEGMFASFATRKDGATGPSLSLEVEKGLPPVWGDAHRLEQIVANLVGNALKFTPPDGRVSLGARRRSAGVEIWVEDTGPGISRQDRQRIFEPFVQAEDPLVRKAQGTGLGLSIAADFARAHGTEITLESEPGRGSRFALALPLSTPQTVEMIELERDVRQQRTLPFFSLLVLEPAPLPDGPSLEGDRLAEVLGKAAASLRSVLPRRSDVLTVQAASGRIILVLSTTPREGALVVRQKLEEHLAERRGTEELGGVGFLVHGPACCPEDGTMGRELIAKALEGSGREGRDDDRR